MATRVIDVRPRRTIRGRDVLWPLLGLVVLVGAIALPSVQSLWTSGDEQARDSLTMAPALTLRSLDALAPLPAAATPTSRYPIGGMAFVRCTNLWTARPDGTGERRRLNMAGLSSPTFSPDGRPIAFPAQGSSAQGIWMVGADGSNPRLVGPITRRGASPGVGSGLPWAPDGRQPAS